MTRTQRQTARQERAYKRSLRDSYAQRYNVDTLNNDVIIIELTTDQVTLGVVPFGVVDAIPSGIGTFAIDDLLTQ